MTDPVDRAVRKAEAFAKERVPPELEDQLAVRVVRDGHAITISESRPPWNPQHADAGWTGLEVAQLRFDPAGSRWTLFWQDRGARWRTYEGMPPASTIEPLLAELDADPTGIFWG